MVILERGEHGAGAFQNRGSDNRRRRMAKLKRQHTACGYINFQRLLTDRRSIYVKIFLRRQLKETIHPKTLDLCYQQPKQSYRKIIHFISSSILSLYQTLVSTTVIHLLS